MTEASYMGMRRMLIKCFLLAIDIVDMAAPVEYITMMKQLLTRAVNP